MHDLRVGFDTGPLYGPKSGIGFAVEALHTSLHAHAEVTLVDYLLSFRAKPDPQTRRLPLPAALAHRCWSRTDHPRVDRWMRDLHVVHGTNYVVPPTSLPRLVSVYDGWFLRHPQHAAAAVVRAGRVLRRAVASGAVIHSCSQATTDVLRECLPGVDVRTVHLGPLPLPSPPAAAPIPDLVGRQFIVAIGTLERRKNLTALVAAFGVLADDLPDLHLVLAGGDGDARTAIDDAVDRLGPGRSSRVLFTGRVDEPTRSWLLHHAAALAYPSLDEGFGFPLLDAMQAGIPVVASTAGSIPEVAGDAALLGPPDDIDLLATHLLAALTDTAQRERLVAAGHRRWTTFSWERCAHEMTAIYRQLAEGST